MPISILALDLGTSTGFAARVDGRVVSGVASFKPSRFEGGGMRYLRYRRWLTELYSSLGGIEEIAFGEVRRHLGVDAAHAYGGFMATLTAWAEHFEVPYQGVPVGTIKKFITGKGTRFDMDSSANGLKRGRVIVGIPIAKVKVSEDVA